MLCILTLFKSELDSKQATNEFSPSRLHPGPEPFQASQNTKFLKPPPDATAPVCTQTCVNSQAVQTQVWAPPSPRTSSSSGTQEYMQSQEIPPAGRCNHHPGVCLWGRVHAQRLCAHTWRGARPRVPHTRGHVGKDWPSSLCGGGRGTTSPPSPGAIFAQRLGPAPEQPVRSGLCCAGFRASITRKQRKPAQARRRSAKWRAKAGAGAGRSGAAPTPGVRRGALVPRRRRTAQRAFPRSSDARRDTKGWRESTEHGRILRSGS
jgi:hypothetical protein